MDSEGRASGRIELSDTDALLATLLGRCTFPSPGTPVTCAVSGGADSLALLVLACRAGCVVTAVHVDHRLRPTGEIEAAQVAAVASRFGARFNAVSVEVAEGPNLEARARRARYDALPADVLVGHTADDRAETMLLNLLRGTGATGLAALGASPRRPLLALRRGDTEAVCASLGLVPLRDPTNSDPRFRRNRVRGEVLPLLAEVAERDVVPLLVRLGDHLAALDGFVELAAANLDPTDVQALRAASPVVARAALRRWLRTGGDEEQHPPDAAAVERVLSVVRGERRATEVGRGRRVARSAGRLHLT